jgi:hypothetical protein
MPLYCMIAVVLMLPSYMRKLPIKYLNNRKTYKTGINCMNLLVMKDIVLDAIVYVRNETDVEFTIT